MSCSNLETDTALIDDLHRTDVEATLQGDVDKLRSLMDPECLLMPPDQDPVPGGEFLEAMRAAINADSMRIQELEQDWQELIVIGNLAWERGVVRYQAVTYGPVTVLYNSTAAGSVAADDGSMPNPGIV